VLESTWYEPWEPGPALRYEQRHPIGTKARLALGLFFFTAQRKCDVVLFGRQHIRGGVLTFTQQKNGNRKPVKLELPVLAALQKIIDASPCGHLTILVTEFGKPFTAKGFGSKFRAWCDEAELPHCTAHGLRKAGAVIAAEKGATLQKSFTNFGYWRPVVEQKVRDISMS
jgi:integrase